MSKVSMLLVSMISYPYQYSVLNGGIVKRDHIESKRFLVYAIY